MFARVVLIGIWLLGAVAEAARILVLLPLPSMSHTYAFTPYFEELALRGHQVTVVTAFPSKRNLANYTNIVLADTFPQRDGASFNLFEQRDTSFISNVLFVYYLCYASCEKVLREPNMQTLIHSNDEEFDLIIYEAFYTECVYGLLHKFKAPKIQIVANTIVPWTGNSVGNPSTTSYVPVLLTDTDELDFTGRIGNFLREEFVYLFRKFYVIPKMDSLMREHFRDPTTPSIEELESDTALLFLHSHPLFHYPRPYTPNTIEVAGLHIRSPQKLPQDLQQLMDDASDGVIYFSLGSQVRSTDIPEKMRNDILKTFSKLKQKVLWKWEKDSLPGQPKNVLLSKWVSQNDVLGHPNMRLFITHGGLMSIQEATHFGVPMIVIPIMADQRFNALRAQKFGSAILLDVHNITEKALTWAVSEVLHQPSYRANAERASRVFRDQPQTPLERAVFWTEFALRHKGAPHMRSAALGLNFFQYHLLDVVAALALGGAAAAALLFVCARAVASRLCSKSRTDKSAFKSKKRN